MTVTSCFYQHMISWSFLQRLKCVTSIFIVPNYNILSIKVKYFEIKDIYFVLPISFNYILHVESRLQILHLQLHKYLR